MLGHFVSVLGFVGAAAPALAVVAASVWGSWADRPEARERERVRVRAFMAQNYPGQEGDDVPVAGTRARERWDRAREIERLERELGLLDA